MAAHRYWRWLFSAAQSGNYAMIGEAELLAAMDGSDVTGTGTASADSAYSENTQPDKAFANNGVAYSSGNALCQCWESGGGAYPHWLQYDFGAGNPQSIVQYTLTAPDTYASETPTAWELQYSDDDSNWTTADTQTGIAWTASQKKTFNCPVPISGNATIAGGGPVDQVVIRDVATRNLTQIVVPASNGDWTAMVGPGNYDITYFATGCQPICHGPYTITA